MRLRCTSRRPVLRQTRDQTEETARKYAYTNATYYGINNILS